MQTSVSAWQTNWLSTGYALSNDYDDFIKKVKTNSFYM